MKKGLFLSVVLVLASGWLRAADIPILNFSFQDPVLGDGWVSYSIPDWTITGGWRV